MGSGVTLYIFILGHRSGLLPLLYSLPEQANPIRAHAASMQLAWGEICRSLLGVPGETASCSILQPYSPGPQLWSRHPGCSPLSRGTDPRLGLWSWAHVQQPSTVHFFVVVVIPLTYQATSQSGSGEDNPEVSCLTYIPTSSVVLQAVHRKMIFADKRWTQGKRSKHINTHATDKDWLFPVLCPWGPFYKKLSRLTS